MESLSCPAVYPLLPTNAQGGFYATTMAQRGNGCDQWNPPDLTSNLAMGRTRRLSTGLLGTSSTGDNAAISFRSEHGGQRGPLYLLRWRHTVRDRLRRKGESVEAK